MSIYLRLTAVDRTEHFVGDEDYDLGVASGSYRAQCGKHVNPAAMVTGPERICAACLEVATPVDWRKPARPGLIERWLRKIGAAA